MKPVRALLSTLAFVLLLLGIHYLHVLFVRVDVVFYAAMADAVIAAGLAAVPLFAWSGNRRLNGFEKTQLIAIWLLAGYAFAISVPTVVDRSLSFYLLEKLQQRGGGIRQDAFEDVFTKEYMVEHRLVDVRLTEQLASGTISIVDGCVTLTDKGRRLAAASRFYRQHFLPKQRLLMGEYTDWLTDPFRRSTANPGYACGGGGG